MSPFIAYADIKNKGMFDFSNYSTKAICSLKFYESYDRSKQML